MVDFYSKDNYNYFFNKFFEAITPLLVEMRDKGATEVDVNDFLESAAHDIDFNKLPFPLTAEDSINFDLLQTLKDEFVANNGC